MAESLNRVPSNLTARIQKLESELVEAYPYQHNLQIHTLPQKWSQSVTHGIWRKDNINSVIEGFIECCEGSQ